MKVKDTILSEKQKIDFGYVVSVTGITNEQIVDFIQYNKIAKCKAEKEHEESAKTQNETP